jgi:hypothetical protein
MEIWVEINQQDKANSQNISKSMILEVGFFGYQGIHGISGLL